MKRIMFLMLAMCLASVVNAQFYNDDNVYCYKLYKIVKDGVPEKANKDKIEFVQFKNNQWMAIFDVGLNSAYVGQPKSHKQYMYEDPYYYKKKMTKLHNDLSKLLAGGVNTSYISSDYFCKYDATNSSTSKYTYMVYLITAHYESALDHYFYREPAKMDFKKIDRCYSFSLDKSEMICWVAGSATELWYYKRVDPDEIGKVDLDFLK